MYIATFTTNQCAIAWFLSCLLTFVFLKEISSSLIISFRRPTDLTFDLTKETAHLLIWFALLEFWLSLDWSQSDKGSLLYLSFSRDVRKNMTAACVVVKRPEEAQIENGEDWQRKDLRYFWVPYLSSFPFPIMRTETAETFVYSSFEYDPKPDQPGMPFKLWCMPAFSSRLSIF